MTFGIFSVLVTQINILESYLEAICFKISYDQKCENCDNLSLEIKILPIFRLYQKILEREHFLGLLRLRKYQTSLQNFLQCENEAVKHDLIEYKVQCLEVFCCHGNKFTVLLFNSIFRKTAEVSSKLYFV